jgi:hypothetical protein
VNDAPIPRCSGFARAEGLDPVGTAGSYRGYVVLEVPLPWPREITEHPALAPAAAALKQADLRLQGVVPPAGRAPGERRLLAFVRPAGPFDRYRSFAWSVPADGVADALVALAAAVAGGHDNAGGAPPAGPAVPVGSGAEVGRHVLVCTHGTRDTCCGAQGTRLATALPGLGAGVHAWRTSHTGGHRFAPTAVLLPEGTAWAYLDLDSLVGISDRTLDLGEAARRYRGCTGLDEAEVQAVEREALLTVGWSWLDHRRQGTVIERGEGWARVRLQGEAPGGSTRAFEGTVEVARLVPVPDCGRPLEEATKSAPELRVRDLTVA